MAHTRTSKGRKLAAAVRGRVSGPDATPLTRLVAEPGPVVTRALFWLLRPLLRVLTKHQWSGAENIPKQGGCIAAANHVSLFDPLVISHYLGHAGRFPYFLAKASLFTKPLIGLVLRRAQQIPVYRASTEASNSLIHAQAALASGKLIVIYPEGTITADPNGWPMAARTGAARLALESGAPLIPIGQWGAHYILGMKRVRWPRLVPRPTIAVAAGRAVDLDDLRTQVTEGVAPAPAVTAATARLMRAITELVAELRGETAPQTPFQPRAKSD